jgi:2-amino-4-hydroxy-6-hydroxymethyldihydropteridine diphosphokinase
VECSSIYETDPLYVAEQPPFLNMVVSGDTAFDPEALLAQTLRIEAACGRDRSAEQRHGPRLLDVDIVLMGDLVVSGAGPQIPHPGLLERRFVLEPLIELSPGLRHPQSGELLASALERLSNQGIYRYECCEYTSSDPTKRARNR